MTWSRRSCSPSSNTCRRSAIRAGSAPSAAGCSSMAEALSQLADPDSQLNRLWDEEHDRYVLRCLLDLMELEFEPTTVQAFRRVALEGVSSADVAQELGISVGAVY